MRCIRGTSPSGAEARWSCFRGGHFGRFGSHQSSFGAGFQRVKRWHPPFGGPANPPTGWTRISPFRYPPEPAEQAPLYSWDLRPGLVLVTIQD